MIEQGPIDPIPPEWLAAFVDDELDPSARRRVKRWFVEHPEVLADLREQKNLSRAHHEYWEAVAPASPTAESWSKAYDRIAKAVMPTGPASYAKTYRRWARSLTAALTIAGLAAAFLVVVVAVDQQRQSRTLIPAAKDGRTESFQAGQEIDDGDHVFRVASADDVDLIQLPEAAASLVVVGRHPMADVPLLLASAGDVQVLNFGPDEQGNWPDIDSMLGPDASMLWAPPSKP